MGRLFDELRQAWRSLLRQPGFLAVAVATLALGIGSVSAIYSVVDGVLLKPLPYPDPDRIVRVSRVQHNWGGPVSGPLLADWREGTRGAFAHLGAYTTTTVNLTGDGEAERLPAVRVTPEFWSVMALAPAHGRYFGEQEERTGEKVVVLGHAFWVRRFGADPGVVGRDIVLNGQPHRVVAIVPDAFRYPGDIQAYLPTYLPGAAAERGSNFLMVVGRLAPAAALAQAEAAVATVNARVAQAFPDVHEGLQARLVPLPEMLTSRIRQPLVILLGAAGLVLLIACANLANLMLARGSHRQRELAVRAAIGGSGFALARSVLAEATLLAVAGTVVGLLLASLAVPALLALAPGVIPAHAAPGLNPAVVAVSLAAAVGTVLVFALWPAWQAARVAPNAVLQEEGRTGGGRRKARARSLLVALEVALSLTLLVGAGLMIESLRALGRVETGVVTEGVLTAGVVVDGLPPIPGEHWTDDYRRQTQAAAPKLDALLERLAAIPGVRQASLSDALPLSGQDNISSNVTLVGGAGTSAQDPPRGSWRFVSPGMFEALGMRIVRGRNLDSSDARPGEFPRTVLVNETFVRRFLQGGEPVGQQVAFFGPDTVATVVGVVSDSRLFGVENEPVPELYMHHAFLPHRQFHLALKVQGDPMDYAEPLRRAVRGLDPAMPLFDVRSMDRMVADTVQMRRFNMTLMAVFSAVALLLAVVGLYGVIAYSVAQRRQEIGIRMSLGAAPESVLRMVLWQGARLVALGLALGLAGAFALGRLIASQLYGIDPLEPSVLVATMGVLAAAALLACLVPAWRAARVDPMVALRGY